MNIDKFRPIPFYFITTDNPEELTYEKAYESLSELKDAGFGGIILFNKPPHGFSAEKYLSAEWFDMVKNFIRACEVLNLRLWINDGFDYPPGGVAGKLAKIDSTLCQQRVKLVNGKVVFEEVEWGYPAFEYKRSSELFIKLVYEAYEREVGEYFGNVIEGFFSDADNRRVNYEVHTEGSRQYDFFPWCKDFEKGFMERYSYNIVPYLEKILRREECEEARDYWEYTSYLYQQWFRNNYKWLKSKGLKYSFHTSDSSPMPIEESQRSSVFLEGRALDIESNSDFPGTDQELLEINANRIFLKDDIYDPEITWGDNDRNIRNLEYYDLYKDVRSKQASSTAFLYDKETALCEMFAASNWGATYSDLRDIACWQVMQGIGFIVPHAYHYRLRGETKYFAPPDFSKKSHLNAEMRKFNDTIATYAAVCNEGKLIAPIALMDITDDLWCGKNIGKEFFDAAEKLNRMPYGYVIADMKGIRRKADEFSVAINPGVSLTDEDKKFLKDNNITVITADELDKLSTLVPADVSYEGSGRPNYMRRMTSDGEMLVVANVQDKEPIKGTVTFNGKSYEIELCCGELCYFTENNACYRKPRDLTKAKKIILPETTEVKWAEDNIIPIERWMNEDYVPILKGNEENEMMFTFTVKSPVGKTALYISEEHMKYIKRITVDGVEKSVTGKEKVFDDNYNVIDITDCMTKGKHKLILSKDGILNSHDLIFIKGEFDALVKVVERCHKFSGYHYGMYRYIPRHAEVFISSPSNELRTDKSWAEQGRPFYSGKAIYKMKVTTDESFKKALLKLPHVGYTAKVYIDGKYIDARLWTPYEYEVELSAGEHEIEIEVTNTLANMLEFYKAPSGLMETPVLYSL